MHTIMVLGAGLALLAIITIKARLDSSRAMRAFLPLWAACSIGNMVYGVVEAGYSWAEEAPILLVVFGVPALIAVALARLRR
jgi:uncharacterized membrane protein YwaF